MSEKDTIFRTFDLNIKRVEHLAGLYLTTRPKGQGRKRTRDTDVLRAAIVLLHATLEDLLRSLCAWKWPSLGDADVLKGVPLRGLARGRQSSEKMTLDRLLEFRKMTADEIIRASVADYLKQFGTYSNIGAVKEALRTCGLDPVGLCLQESDLADLIARRHSIVHHADRNPSTGRGHHRAKGVNKGRVDAWIGAVKALGDEVRRVL